MSVVIVDNSTTGMVAFSSVSEGDMFKDEDGVLYIKKAVETANNAVQIADGSNHTFADATFVQSVTAEVKVTN